MAWCSVKHRDSFVFGRTIDIYLSRVYASDFVHFSRNHFSMPFNRVNENGIQQETKSAKVQSNGVNIFATFKSWLESLSPWKLHISYNFRPSLLQFAQLVGIVVSCTCLQKRWENWLVIIQRDITVASVIQSFIQHSSLKVKSVRSWNYWGSSVSISMQ